MLTVDEMREQLNRGPSKNDTGDAPVNPSLVSVWQAAQQQAQNPGPGGPFEQPEGGYDFGDRGEGDEEGQDNGGESGGKEGGAAGGEGEPEQGSGKAPEFSKAAPPAHRIGWG